MRDAEALHAAVSDLVRIYQFRDRDRICCYDISVTQCYALECLVEHGAMRSQALAERLMLDKSTTTRVVDALERKGYVARSTAPARCLSRVTIATRTGTGALPAIMRLGVVEGRKLDRREPALGGKGLGVPTRLAAHEEGDLAQFGLGLGSPGPFPSRRRNYRGMLRLAGHERG